jgi:N-acetylneuraminate synthase
MSIYIIGEIGINHNGDIEIAKSLISEAKSAGCDAVKFQKRDINLVYKQEFLDSYRDSPWGNTQRDQKEGLEFEFEEYSEIDSHCKKLNIDWFASAWDIKSQKFLNKFDCERNKIASAMIVCDELLKKVAKERKHTYISTGMSGFEEIKKAVDIFRDTGCSFELMHCRSTYPMRDDHANLSAIKTLRDSFKCDVGYSGHESGLAISYAASSLGITSLERHITLDRTMYGSDQAASIEPAGLRMLVGAVRKIESAMGDGEIDVLDEEFDVAKNLRQHL